MWVPLPVGLCLGGEVRGAAELSLPHSNVIMLGLCCFWEVPVP